MFFNKWKRRALEERAQNLILEMELEHFKGYVKQLEATHKFVEHSDLARKVLDLRQERLIKNLPADKLYIKPSELSGFLASTPVFKGGVNCSVTMLFGLAVYYTSDDMRVE